MRLDYVLLLCMICLSYDHNFANACMHFFFFFQMRSVCYDVKCLLIRNSCKPERFMMIQKAEMEYKKINYQHQLKAISTQSVDALAGGKGQVPIKISTVKTICLDNF